MPEHPKMLSAGGDDSGIQASLENSAYGGNEPPEETKAVPAHAKNSLNMRQASVGARPIRWGWWAAALVLSVGLWWMLYRLFF